VIVVDPGVKPVSEKHAPSPIPAWFLFDILLVSVDACVLAPDKVNETYPSETLLVVIYIRADIQTCNRPDAGTITVTAHPFDAGVTYEVLVVDTTVALLVLTKPLSISLSVTFVSAILLSYRYP
jgi:hypothetical protein